MAELQQQLDSNQAELREAIAQKEDVRGELEAALQAIRQLRSRHLTQTIPDTAGATARLKRAETEVGELRAQLSQLKEEAAREIRAADERAALATSQAEGVSEVYAAYQADKKMLGQAVELLQAERDSLEQRARGAEVRLAEQKAAVAASEEARGELETTLAAARGDARVFAEKVAQLQAEKDELEQTAGALRVEYASAREAMDAQCSGRVAVEAQQAAERSEKERLQQQLITLEATRADLKAEIGASHAQAEQLHQLLVTQDSEREELQRECDRLTQLLHGERGSMAAMRTEAAMLQEQLKQQQVSGKNLHDAMQSGRGELLEAQLASRRAESDAALLRRQLLELELCQSQLGDAQRQLTEARGAAQAAQAAQQQQMLHSERLQGQLRVLREEAKELQAPSQYHPLSIPAGRPPPSHRVAPITRSRSATA